MAAEVSRSSAGRTWREAVEERRETIEAIAAAGGPLAEDMEALLAEADAAGGGD